MHCADLFEDLLLLNDAYVIGDTVVYNDPVLNVLVDYDPLDDADISAVNVHVVDLVLLLALDDDDLADNGSLGHHHVDLGNLDAIHPDE